MNDEVTRLRKEVIGVLEMRHKLCIENEKLEKRVDELIYGLFELTQEKDELQKQLDAAHKTIRKMEAALLDISERSINLAVVNTAREALKDDGE